MDRRTFVAGAFGLVVLGACSGTATVSLSGCSTANATPAFTTPATGEPEDATGPLMMAGIDVFELPETGRYTAFYGDTELFNMDATGAALVSLADGKRSIDDIAVQAAALGHTCKPVDVALFFSSLGNAGFLRNLVTVSILDRRE